MNAIRKITKVTNGKIEVKLPIFYEGQEVEIIVLTNPDNSKNIISKADRKKSVKKFAGIFNKYANPEIIPFEKEIAWTKIAKEKYDSR